MQLRILKRLPLTEVYEKVRILEKKYSGSLEAIPDYFVDGRMGPEAFEDYAEWLGMVHALRAYSEGEDFDYYTEEILTLPWEMARKLTPRRIELLDELSRIRVSSINELASTIGRNVKNVYNDVKTLEHMGFIELVKEGRNTVPTLLVHEVTILLW